VHDSTLVREGHVRAGEDVVGYCLTENFYAEDVGDAGERICQSSKKKMTAKKVWVEWNGEIGLWTPDCYSHLLGLTLQIRVHDCNMVVAANHIAERGEALFYALDFDFGRKRVAQMLQFLVCGGCGDEKTFAVTEGKILVFVFSC
jgi:hypothetical protein